MNGKPGEKDPCEDRPVRYFDRHAALLDAPLGFADGQAAADRLTDEPTAETGAGTIADTLTYTAFGGFASETDPPNGSEGGYVGGWLDEAMDLYTPHWRSYDPGVGQWVSEDPIGFAAGDVNLRRYVGNGATNGVDPAGLADEKKQFKRQWSKGKVEFWETQSGDTFAQEIDKAQEYILKTIEKLEKAASDEQKSALKFIRENLDVEIVPVASFDRIKGAVPGSQAVPDIAKYQKSKDKSITVDMLAMVNVVVVKAWGKNYEIEADFNSATYFVDNALAIPFFPRKQLPDQGSGRLEIVADEIGFVSRDDLSSLFDGKRILDTELDSNWTFSAKLLNPNRKKDGDKRTVVSPDRIDLRAWSTEQIASLLVNEILHFYDVNDAHPGTEMSFDKGIQFGQGKQFYDFKSAVVKGTVYKDPISRTAFMYAFYYGEFPKFAVKK